MSSCMHVGRRCAYPARHEAGIFYLVESPHELGLVEAVQSPDDSVYVGVYVIIRGPKEKRSPICR